MRTQGGSPAPAGYFERRALRRTAGAASLWALGVGAAIDGQLSGWNYGLLAGGWGGLVLAATVIAALYICLSFSIAEMAAAQPLAGGPYAFVRSALGPVAGVVTGVCAALEYILVSAVGCFYLAGCLTQLTGLTPDVEPVLWFVIYFVFVGLNVRGTRTALRVALVLTLLALAAVLVFCALALPHAHLARYALDIGADGRLQPQGHGPMFPMGWRGVLAALPSAVWLFLAVEQIPLAAEEARSPARDVPRALWLAMATLVVSAGLVIWLNSSVRPGAYALAHSPAPMLDGLRALYQGAPAALLLGVSVIGLAATLHPAVFAFGREIYALSRAGHLPRPLSVTRNVRRTPAASLAAGAGFGLVVMGAAAVGLGPHRVQALMAPVLINMGVFAAMLSYLAQSVAFVVLRLKRPDLPRPYRSPLGVTGAVVCAALSLVTLACQLHDRVYRVGAVVAALWIGCGLMLALMRRERMMPAPEQGFPPPLAEEG